MGTPRGRGDLLLPLRERICTPLYEGDLLLLPLGEGWDEGITQSKHP